MASLRHLSGLRALDRGALEQWSRSPRGQRLLALEAREIARVLPDVFGRHVLQVGSWDGDGSLIASAETLHRAVLGTVPGARGAALVAPERLPLASKSVDAVLLPHTLEFSRSPHQVLREVDRVLNDRGRLFVLGFSPWSPWAWRTALGLRHRDFPAAAQFYGSRRVGDWLQLLDYDVVETRRFGVGFPWLAPRSVGQPWSPGALLAPLAEAYLLVARKRVLPINFIGRTARAQVRPLVGVGVPAAQRIRDGEPDTTG
ncbi:MAG TPA: methyltransferase domain-containing protein [Solimonas sp.]|nr:methyltransferase domain-containing protein [Solimonas sp.]